ncbi:MAG: glycosyltransferase, partial [Acidimicrobiales bacterium]
LPDAVTTVVKGLRGRDEAFELLICQNGSTDQTTAVASTLASQYPEVTALDLNVADYGAALRLGFLASRGDLVVNFDVDFVDLDFLSAAVVLLEQRHEISVVVGSKRSPDSHDRRRPGRRLVTAVFGLVLRHVFGLQVSDTHGLKALRRARLAPLVEACQFGEDIFDTELILRAERAGLGVAELPVTVDDQRPPRTSIVGRIPRSLLGLARLRLSLWR